MVVGVDVSTRMAVTAETAARAAGTARAGDRPGRAAGGQNSGSAGRIGLPEEMGGKAPATIVVNLPAGARLKVNNVPAGRPASSTSRKLVSPPLERGKDYHYTLKVEIVRDGRTLTA